MTILAAVVLGAMTIPARKVPPWTLREARDVLWSGAPGTVGASGGGLLSQRGDEILNGGVTSRDDVHETDVDRQLEQRSSCLCEIDWKCRGSLSATSELTFKAAR